MTNNYCRLCANQIPEYDLIDILGSKNGLEHKILRCLQLQITEIDNLPKQTCVDCESKVCLFYDFHTKVYKAQDTLQIELKPQVAIEVEENVIDESKIFKEECVSSDVDNFCSTEDSECLADNEPKINTFSGENNRIKKIHSRIKGELVKLKNPEESLEEIEEMKQMFYTNLETLAKSSNIILDETYSQIINEIEEIDTKVKKLPVENKHLARYEIYRDKDKKRLIGRRKTVNSRVKYYLPKSEIFDVIRNVHLACRHGSIKKTYNSLRSQYKNLNWHLVTTFISLCKVCVERRTRLSLQKEKRKLDNKCESKVKRIRITVSTWKCKECDKILPSPYDLNQHYELIHKKPAQYTCMECNLTYDNYKTFRYHLLKHINKFRFRCEICDIYFVTARKLREHNDRHNQVQQNNYPCTICGANFRYKYSLTRHEKKIHHSNQNHSVKQVVKLYNCDQCHKKFASLLSIKNHKLLHAGVLEYICEYCGKFFLRKQGLMNHIITHNEDKPYKCNLCPGRYKTKKSLQWHSFLHSGLKPFECEVCNKKFARKQSLSLHTIVHTDLYPFTCNLCGKKLRYKKDLTKHQINHVCEICSAYLSSSKKLREHKQRHNEFRQKYFCETCGAGFLNAGSIKRHEKVKHLGISERVVKQTEKKYECDVCHKWFTSIGSRNTHKKVHTGIYEHVCEFCGKGFIHKQYLEDHISIHSDKRPFKCEICSGSYKSKRDLRRHTFLHTGVKPHKCEVCGKKFPRKGNLTAHSIIHTDLYPFKCDMCEKQFRYKKNLVKHQTNHI